MPDLAVVMRRGPRDCPYRYTVLPVLRRYSGQLAGANAGRSLPDSPHPDGMLVRPFFVSHGRRRERLPRTRRLATWRGGGTSSVLAPPGPSGHDLRSAAFHSARRRAVVGGRSDQMWPPVLAQVLALSPRTHFARPIDDAAFRWPAAPRLEATAPSVIDLDS